MRAITDLKPIVEALIRELAQTGNYSNQKVTSALIERHSSEINSVREQLTSMALMQIVKDVGGRTAKKIESERQSSMFPNHSGISMVPKLPKYLRRNISFTIPNLSENFTIAQIKELVEKYHDIPKSKNKMISTFERMISEADERQIPDEISLKEAFAK
ncbi:hypothetical protein JOD31_002528 [Methylopila capsulata]|uniref:Uncharacterized protein n=1 Tax=Methylopila capsulata TaxID=61654 RepID=A0A9W6IWB7_9HYPH|nr:hypothetical protein [Methylopila capsulata]MBM7852286.1 hypothetical protein [Methylopila capsulata]GLK56495.1 hypothetical protein GCM10008170_25140 [Methylopila capsulata]